MLSDITQRQIAALGLRRDRPLLICDVDDVILHFLREFEDFLAVDGLWLDPASFALHGNVRRKAGNERLANAEISRLIDRFFVERTRRMQPIEGAVEALLALGECAEVVLLTNLPHTSGEDRRANLKDHGINFPVVTNSGPKGPAILALRQDVRHPVVFIDDSPLYIESSRQHAPDVHLVHFLHDQRFARHHTPFDWVSLTAANWQETSPHVQALFGVGSERNARR